MRVVSFNVNGIRARIHQLESLIAHYNPDIISLQETKVADEEFPASAIEALGYHVSFFGQKGHYGVAIMSRTAPTLVNRGLSHDPADAQRRLITANFEYGNETVTVINGYFPQGENRDHPTKFPNKRQFYTDLTRLLDDSRLRDAKLIVMGDLNISPEDIDIGIGADNAKRWLRQGKCSFLPEEREWLAALKAGKLADTYRHLHPDTECYSWFDYRSRGFDRDPKRGLRIDLILASRSLLNHATDAGIAYDIRGQERPSDHAPVWTDFALD